MTTTDTFSKTFRASIHHPNEEGSLYIDVNDPAQFDRAADTFASIEATHAGGVASVFAANRFISRYGRFPEGALALRKVDQ